MLEDKVTEKVYCYDHPSAYNNHDALAIAAMANKGNSGCNAADMMALMNGNQWNNSPWMYLVFMWMFGNGGFGGWGNNRGNLVQDAEIQNQIASLRSQMADNHNSDLLMSAIQGNNQDMKTLAANLNCDFNQLQSGVCAVRSAIEQVAGQVGFSAERVINAANLGDLNIVQQLKDCCCQTQQNIIKMGYENQLGQKDILNGMQMQTNSIDRGLDFVNRSIERGFSSLGFQNAQDKCEIIRANQDNTQRIIDVMNCHWNQDLQQRYNDARLELSQQRQNAELIAALKTTTTTTATT